MVKFFIFKENSRYRKKHNNTYMMTSEVVLSAHTRIKIALLWQVRPCRQDLSFSQWRQVLWNVTLCHWINKQLPDYVVPSFTVASRLTRVEQSWTAW